MEVINGEWYMTGCREDDPSCIHSVDELAKLIRKIGFLPLFGNEISGFSVEERTVTDHWWSGDPAKDPWEWRQALARNKDIAYGKFFHKKAGYVSKKWFPVFANYRRNGYDFEALVGDELASHRAKKVMNALELDDEMRGIELLSFELKEKAGFGKGGEKNYEGVITELQMQTYLLMSNFRQKTNKNGQPYGWHIAALETPESKWGYDYIADRYKEAPEESWIKIVDQVQKCCPDADEKAIRKVMGIRYPGETATKTRKKPEPAYPMNLIKVLGIPVVSRSLSDDQMEGLAYALESIELSSREVIRAKYKDGKTYQEIADDFRIEKKRIRSIHDHAIRMLKRDNRLPYIRDGYCGWQMKLAEQENLHKEYLERSVDSLCARIGLDNAEGIRISDIGISARSRNALARQDIITLWDFLILALDNPKWIREINSFGIGSLEEFRIALKAYGIELDEEGSLK
ncbi:MAG: hypothetical protein IKF90_25970 [Parasporobacterium sp.]|nr:hypothetical protein [Parasporobacterium sp.]